MRCLDNPFHCCSPEPFFVENAKKKLPKLSEKVFALIVLTVAAAESAIGLAILVIYYRIRGSIAIELINLMKGEFLCIY
jgi:NADH:ubiquinone oxidoreductase subunit K